VVANLRFVLQDFLVSLAALVEVLLGGVDVSPLDLRCTVFRLLLEHLNVRQEGGQSATIQPTKPEQLLGSRNPRGPGQPLPLTVASDGLDYLIDFPPIFPRHLIQTRLNLPLFFFS
jgi:hypothetical protein